MPRFFVPKENISENKILIDSSDVAHITRVLRLSIGDEILICDGSGYDYDAKIAEISKSEIVCGILAKRPSKTEADIAVTIYQGIPKASKMDYIIQKTTELGAVRIVPVAMARCVSKVEDKKSEKKKLDRWNKIAAEAAKQSQRGIVPKVLGVMSFDEAIDKMKSDDLCFAPYECEEKRTLREALLSDDKPKTVSFMIGPEGGYDLMEIEKLQAAGIKTVTLGRRILRTETAGEAVLAMVMYEIGDINKLED